MKKGGHSAPIDGTGRLAGVDAMKAAAIFCVILIHVCSAGYAAPLGSADWFAAIFWGAVARPAVPVFFLCSGAVFYDPLRPLPVRKLYGRHVLRIVLAMLFWGMVYKVYHLAAAGALSPIALLRAGKEVLLFRQEFHLYFLHMILLFYVLAPAVRVFTGAADLRQMRYALAVWLLLGIVYPTVRGFWPFTLLSGIPAQWLLNMTWASVGYGILGYFLYRSPMPTQWSIAVTAVGFLLTFGGTVLISLERGILYQGFYEGMSAGPALMAAGLFSLSTRVYRCGRLTQLLARASFCIYLVHVLFLRLLNHFGITAAVLPGVTAPAISFVILLLSLGIYLLLRRVPLTGKWLT